MEYKGHSTIFNVMSSDEFQRVSNYEASKEAWDTLEIVHQGSKGVKKSKLQM